MMARLYSLVGTTVHQDPEYGYYYADPADGGFAFPDEVSDVQQTFAVKGQKLWETQAERTARLHSADLAAQRDPAALYRVIEGIANVTTRMAEHQLGTAPASAPLDKEAEIAALRARLAELEGPQDTPAPGGGPVAEDDPPKPGPAVPAKATRSRKPAGA